MNNKEMEIENQSEFSIFSKKTLKSSIKAAIILIIISASLTAVNFLFFDPDNPLNKFFNLIFIEAGTLLILGAIMAVFEPLKEPEGQTINIFTEYEKNPSNIAKEYSREELSYIGKIMMVSSLLLIVMEIILESLLKIFQ